MTLANSRVLLLEDNAPLVRLLSRVLQAAGADLSTAQSLAAARAILSGQRLDLAICDLTLPDASGDDVCAALSAFGGPVVLISGRPLTEPEARWLDQPGDRHFIQKPFMPSDLMATLAAV